MACKTGLWKTILFAALVAVLTYGAPAFALVTIEIKPFSVLVDDLHFSVH